MRTGPGRCEPSPGAGADSGVGTVPDGPDTGTEDSGDPHVPLLARTRCEAVSAAGPDPLLPLGYTDTDSGGAGILVELVDSVVEGERFWGVGQGGIVSFDLSGSAPVWDDVHPTGGAGRFHRITLVDATPPLAYVTNRNNGLEVMDLSDPTSVRRVHLWGRSGLGGMAVRGDRMYVAQLNGGVLVLDISSPLDPVERESVSADGRPWTVALGTEVLYTADNLLGVGVFSLADPDRPAWVRNVDVGAGVQEIVVDGDTLYAAAGSAGLVLYSLADPLNPTETGRLALNGAVIDVAVADGVAWVVDHEGVWAIDVRDPAAPASIGHENTPRWAMTVTAEGDTAWVGDWSAVGGYQVSLETPAPDLRISPDTVRLIPGITSREVVLHNDGQAPLSLLGWDTSVEAAQVEVPAQAIPAGATVKMRVEWPASAPDGTICLVSDDPDAAVLELDVQVNGSAAEFLSGTPAPDFALEGLDGETYRLSEQLGHPVVLVYFATW